ncbi:MAG TPA: SLC45 family MFS transporter [Acholeplasmataceae bacterium]|nr:SLC45 family MFS transporter [Acholeplasmataceae bacterium]
MKEMKLDYKKTIYVGLAFLLISMFWQTYDNIIGKILIDKFGLNQTWSGLVMAVDNILALALLPLFGMLSDKTRTKIGKRTPYIIIGTLIAALAFVSLSFVDNSQTNKINTETTIITDYEEVNAKIVAGDMLVDDWDNIFDDIKAERDDSLSKGVITENDYKRYETNISGAYDNIIEEGKYTEEIGRFDQREIADIYYNYLSTRAWELTRNDTKNLYLFIGILLIVLVAMSTFRSPAVALMPDVTVKPSRSKANAVINLLGAVGGITSILLISLLGLSKASYVSYTPIFVATSILMVVALIIFLFKVNEPKLIEQYNSDVLDYGLDEEDIAGEDYVERKLGKKELLSLVLILLSVFFWFSGYNAVTTKLSDYAPKMLNMDFATPLLVAQATAIIAFIPIGILSSKIGRKKMILAGIILLTICFGSAYFLDAETGQILYLVLALTGVAWATINVNSFPMVVELASGSNVGKYTGYYYTFSMAAQIMTPILSGLLMDNLGRGILFPYATVFVAISFVTMFFVKHGDSKPVAKKGLEAFDVED